MATREQKEEAVREREEKRIAALDGIGMALEADKEKAVRWRAEYELMWMEAYQQYQTSAQYIAPAKREGSTIAPETEEYRQTSDNITRPKVIVISARMSDMLFPTTEANWDMDASPKPDIPDELLPPPQPGPPDPETGEQAPPQPYTPDQIELLKQQIAKKAAGKMRTEIKDQLAESKYDDQGRATIFDGCLYGTGVMRGPVVKAKRRHLHGQGGYNPVMKQQAKPTVEHVDLWSFYPQPSRNMEECEHVHVLHVLPKRGLRKLSKQKGFDSAQIQRLLNQEPVHGGVATSALDRGVLRPDANVVLSERYTVWEYRGPMPKEGLKHFVDGLMLQGELNEEEARQLTEEMEKDQLSEIDCEVWFCQGIVIKMALSTLPSGDLGFYVFNYEKNPASIFGYGVAHLCRDDQLAANQLWHAMMLNTMMSAGPQIGVRKGSLEAQGGRTISLSASKPRVWALNEEITDIRHALSVFVIPNVTKDMMAVYERAKANADEHTLTPMIAQGEPTSATPTSSGTAMLMNAANVVNRRLAKSWDADITIPMIGNLYDWNMAFNPDESIKGDYCVIAKGSSHLLVKDVQTQHIQFATQMFSNNPMLAPYMKPRAFADRNIEMLDLSVQEMLFTDAEMEENAKAQGEQPDPETIKAQAAMATAQAAMERVKLEGQIQQARLEAEAEDRRLAHQERMADIEARMRIQEMQLMSADRVLMGKMAEMERDERIEMERLFADIQKHGSQLDLEQYRVDTATRLGAEKIASQEMMQAEEIKVEKANPKVKVQ